MELNEKGRVAHDCWLSIPKHHANISLDEFVVMPNHVHGIIVINYRLKEAKKGGGSDVARNAAPEQIPRETNITSHRGTIPSPKRGSLAVVIRSFKSAVTNKIRSAGYYDFEWQRRYYDRIVRDRFELNRIRKYITKNPSQWDSANQRTRRRRPVGSS